MTEFTVGKLAIPYTLNRSNKARNVHIEMTIDKMSVTAPATASLDAINKALYSKRRWIVENNDILKQKNAIAHKVARFRTGAKIPYWGRLTKLTTKEHAVENAIVSYDNGLLVFHQQQPDAETHDAHVEKALQEWMKQKLWTEANRFCKRYADKLEVDYQSLRIKALKSSWGSCGKSGIVSIDWHLVFAPKRVLQYVIAHELTHMIERNHSAKFWTLLKSVYGDYQQEHDWLCENEHLLGYLKIPTNINDAAIAHRRNDATLPSL